MCSDEGIHFGETERHLDGVRRSMRKRKQGLAILFLLIYVFAVIWFTVLNRAVRYHVARFELFWSYRAWLAGDTGIGREILLNIALFIPLGLLLPSVFPAARLGVSKKKQTIIVVAVAAVFSLLIELLQLVSIRGLFEWDDLISNTLGAAIGFCIYSILGKTVSEKHFTIICRGIGAVVALVCIGVIICYDRADAAETENTARAYCFQIDEASYDKSSRQLAISGFAFQYEYQTTPFALALKSSRTGEQTKLSTTCKLARPDVNAYFACDYDYTASGFRAETVIDPAEEYEVMIRWPWSLSYLSTGVYVKGDDVHYVPEREFVAPENGGPELDGIIDNGILLVYRPDFHCWVYQLNGFLYWIVDQGFAFEDDGTTLIVYTV